jgi:hypothetical protein
MFQENEQYCCSRNISTHRQVSCLCEGGIQFSDNSFSCSEMEPWNKEQTELRLRLLQMLSTAITTLSFKRETQLVLVQQENNSIPHVVHTASSFTLNKVDKEYI